MYSLQHIAVFEFIDSIDAAKTSQRPGSSAARCKRRRAASELASDRCAERSTARWRTANHGSPQACCAAAR